MEIKKIIEKCGGVIKASQLKAEGITQYEIKKLIDEGSLERIRQGYYRLTTQECSEANQIAELFPDGVICMYSALFYYKYSDRTPARWDIAIDKNVSRSRFNMDYPYVKAYYTEPHLLTFGIDIAEYEDCKMKIYDRDRLICECIKFEAKMDRESYNKAIQGYVNDAKKNIPQLLKYAEKRKIAKKVKDRIGVWL